VPRLLLQRRQQVRKLREAADVLLRPDRLAVGDHVELALFPCDHLGVVPESVQLRHETRGACVIPVSDGAVIDRDARHESTVATRKPVTAQPRIYRHAVLSSYAHPARDARGAAAHPHRLRQGRRRVLVLGGLVELGVRLELLLDDLDDLVL
jgi:hypothetical protein